MEIKDSGNRREFESGAVRDVAEGKGRCDLLPLGLICNIYLNKSSHLGGGMVLGHVQNYMDTGDTNCLEDAIECFLLNDSKWEGNWSTLFLEVAKHYEEGAKKYAERNWEKGINLHCYIDSGVRHYLKWLRGDTDEPHDRAFVWNMLGAIWTHAHMPHLIDLPFAKEERADDGWREN